MKNKIKVVMLPTKQGVIAKNEKGELLYALDYLVTHFDGDANHTPQHIHLICDEIIYHNRFGNQDIDLNEVAYDSRAEVVGKVSHVGGGFNFKATLQFPKDNDLQKNRHITHDCRKVLATTDESLGLPMLPEWFVKDYVSDNDSIDEILKEDDFAQWHIENIGL